MNPKLFTLGPFRFGKGRRGFVSVELSYNGEIIHRLFTHCVAATQRDGIAELKRQSEMDVLRAEKLEIARREVDAKLKDLRESIVWYETRKAKLEAE